MAKQELVKPGMKLKIESNLPEVRVMAVAGNWAMVRRVLPIGAKPFTYQVKHLISLNKLESPHAHK
jgi:hypothetical protein